MPTPCSDIEKLELKQRRSNDDEVSALIFPSQLLGFGSPGFVGGVIPLDYDGSIEGQNSHRLESRSSRIQGVESPGGALFASSVSLPSASRTPGRAPGPIGSPKPFAANSASKALRDIRRSAASRSMRSSSLSSREMRIFAICLSVTPLAKYIYISTAAEPANPVNW